jgi:hypothetical protein
MADISNVLQSLLNEQTIGQLSKQLGANPEQTSTAASGVVTTLVSALAKNAGSPEGAGALMKALDKDHDGSILDDITGLLSGQAVGAGQRAANGAGIVGHVLGNRQSGAVEMVSKVSGLQGEQVNQLMTMLAPLVMGALGKAKNQGGLDLSSLVGMLGQTAQQQQAQNPMMATVTRFLDQDGDGSIVDDVADMGMKMLGGFFNKGK